LTLIAAGEVVYAMGGPLPTHQIDELSSIKRVR
jgi:hypothetical protein